MSEPTARDDARSCTRPTGIRTCYGDRCDLLLGLDRRPRRRRHVTGDGGREGRATPPSPMSCRTAVQAAPAAAGR